MVSTSMPEKPKALSTLDREATGLAGLDRSGDCKAHGPMPMTPQGADIQAFARLVHVDHAARARSSVFGRPSFDEGWRSGRSLMMVRSAPKARPW